MILTRTPLRISFAGGGTDLPAYYERYGPGRVVSATIAPSVYVAVSERFEGDVRVSYSETEVVSTVAGLRHDLIRSALRACGVYCGVEVVTVADVPGRGTGLGSSSALLVGALLGAYTLQRFPCDATRLAHRASAIEQGFGAGSQDAYAAAHGGFRQYWFEGESTSTQALEVSAEKQRTLEDWLVLVHTGIARQASGILAEQQRAITADARHGDDLTALAAAADDAARLLEAGDAAQLGELLGEQWARKRRLPGATTPEIDSLYHLARKEGAVGGKLCGAGGGGFLLLAVPPERRAGLCVQLQQHGAGKVLPVRFHNQGASIVYQGGAM